MQTGRIASAFAFALQAHGNQLRKGTGVPYFTHLMAVSAMVGEYGGDEDQMIAALLHDSLEDCPDVVSFPLLVQMYGWRVAQIVAACSDCQTSPKPPWEERKKAFLERLATEPADAKLVSAADKLHNTRALVRDYQAIGESMWDRFNAKKERQCWYLRQCVIALRHEWYCPILVDLDHTVTELEHVCGIKGPGGSFG